MIGRRVTQLALRASEVTPKYCLRYPLTRYLRDNAWKVKAGIEAQGLLGFSRTVACLALQRLPGRWRHLLYFLWILFNEYELKFDWSRGAPSSFGLPEGSRTLISVVMPVFNTDLNLLRLAIRSVVRQTYSSWELCIHDDGSTAEGVLDFVREQAARDGRIRFSSSPVNGGIAFATNAALALAQGDFVAFLDHHDELAPNALAEVARAIQANPNVDWIYSDEDKIDAHGIRHAPYFKPDWNPDLLLSQNYICHLTVYRRSLLQRLGGFREGFDGAQDFDLALRASVATSAERIVHIPLVLYHWRTAETSTARSAAAKPAAGEAGVRALQDYLEATGQSGGVRNAFVPTFHDGTFYRVKRSIRGRPSVTVIVPTRDNAAFLRRCITSIRGRTSYDNYMVMVVDNGSRDPDTLEYLDMLRKDACVRVVERDVPFNFSALNNYAVDLAESDYVLLLNDDTEVISRDWIQAMLEHAQRPEVGVVGARLLYPDRRVQHAGVFIRSHGRPDHAFKRTWDDDGGYFGQSLLIRDCSAVTAACLLVSRGLFKELGGFDEARFGVAYNDVDFCLRVRATGRLIVYTPYAKLIHHESVSRGQDDELARESEAVRARVMQERAAIAEVCERLCPRDPYYSVHLGQETALWHPRAFPCA